MLLLTTSGLFWDMFISLIGVGFIMYGRKRPDAAALIAGLILVIYPYFIKSIEWDIAVGITIIIVYIFLKRVVRI